MGRGKKNVLILFLIAIICTGCVSFSNKNTINSSYEEWIDEIGLLNEEGLKVDTYRETEEYIEVVLRCDKSENQFTQFNELVQKHNEFVDKNVGYFENKSVYFIYEDAFLTYFSKPCEHYGNQYLNEISTNKETMSFLKINCSSMVNELEKQEIKFDVPNLILSASNTKSPDFHVYSVLSQFTGLENVIVDYRVADYDIAQIAGYIHEYAPNVRIYEKNKDHLEEYIPPKK